MNKIANTLNKAADLIETKGWCQRSEAIDANDLRTRVRSRKAVAFCVLGAIQKCSKTEVIRLETIEFLCSVIDSSVIGPNYAAAYTTVWVWNDAKRRTKEQVIKKLRQAASLAEKQR
jgi:hypothetical protein